MKTIIILLLCLSALAVAVEPYAGAVEQRIEQRIAALENQIAELTALLDYLISTGADQSLIDAVQAEITVKQTELDYLRNTGVYDRSRP